MNDFIIVGRGLAATTLMHVFHSRGISFKVIGKTDLSSCSLVAAGIWNPIVFKRLTKSWKADKLIPVLNQFYSECEQRLGAKFVNQRMIIRPFREEQEKVLWEKKSKNELDEFLDAEIRSASSAPLNTQMNLGFGQVKQAGNIDLPHFLETSSTFFKNNIIDEQFFHEKLKLAGEEVEYASIRAKSIIFCEGHLVKNNPFFSWVPLKPAKGEIITVQIKDLNLGQTILNSSAFVMEVKKDEYKVGATYEWKELNELPGENAGQELEQRLQNMLNVTYRVVDHKAGIRPSSADRRPIIGAHPLYRQLYIFNGLGTKGVMLAPYFATNFVNFYLHKEGLEPEVDISRFYALHKKL